MTQRAQESKGFGVTYLVLVPVETFTCCVTLGQLLHLSEFQFQLQQSYRHAPHRNICFKAHQEPKGALRRTQSALTFRAGSRCVLRESWERWVLQRDTELAGALALPLLSLTAVWGRGLGAVSGWLFVCVFVPLMTQNCQTNWHQ